jgi:hypothetical protein
MTTSFQIYLPTTIHNLVSIHPPSLYAVETPTSDIYEFLLRYIYKCHSYLTGNTFHLCYNDQLVNTIREAICVHKYYVSGHYPSSCFYIKHHPVLFKNTVFLETGFCLHLQVNPTQSGRSQKNTTPSSAD